MEFLAHDHELETLFVDLASSRSDFATVTISRDGSTVAIVDWESLPLIAGRTWSLHSCGKGKLYVRNDRFNGERVRVYMHRLIAKHFLGDPPKAGMVVDHIDGDGLNNRRQNFRWMDAYENRWLYARHKQ